MSNLDKSIDNNAIKGVMYLEQAISAIDNLYTLYYEELRVASAKGDEEESDFIKKHMTILSNIQNRLEGSKDYLNDLVGLSWEVYKSNIQTKKKDDENSDI
jgi:hypothetical protein